ncbi:hypothetical protein JCM10049v2_004638 [Rhodotorula toruloides]
MPVDHTAQTTHSVKVSNLAATTSKETLEHFFSFCGKIASIEGPSNGSAEVNFVKESAAKTALMLTGGTLDGSVIEVKSDEVEAPKAAHAQPPIAAAGTSDSHDEIEQEDKPRSAIVAEYLAHGYVLSDQAVNRAIEADKSYGITERFLRFFNPLKDRVTTAASPHVERAQQKFAEVDQKQGLSLKAQAGWIVGRKYYSAALASPFGAKVHQFYTSAQKNALDIHEEAKRIAEAKKREAGGATGASTVPTTGTATSTTLPHDAPLPSQGTVEGTEASGAALNKPLESSAAPLKG